MDNSNKINQSIYAITGMTIEVANSTIWTFNKINRPLGEAFKNGVISFDDLRWGCKQTYSKKIQNAARTILISHLFEENIESKPKPMRVFLANRHSEFKESDKTLAGGIFLGIPIGFVITFIVLVLMKYIPIIKNNFTNTLTLLSFICLFISLSFIIKGVMYLKGRRGEEKATEILRILISGDWTLFRNITFPDKKWGDIDIILVGSGGIYVFEVKSYSGNIRNIGSRWEKKCKHGWCKLSLNPGKQARLNAVNLKNFLSENGIEVTWIQPIIIWVTSESLWKRKMGSIYIKNPETPVWNADSIQKHISELWSRELGNDKIEDIVNVLKKNCDERISTNVFKDVTTES